MTDKTAAAKQRPRPEPDLGMLVAGLLSLAVSASILFGGTWHLDWIFACCTVGIAMVILIVARWRRRD